MEAAIAAAPAAALHAEARAAECDAFILLEPRFDQVLPLVLISRLARFAEFGRLRDGVEFEPLPGVLAERLLLARDRVNREIAARLSASSR